MDNWAPFVTGYQTHTRINERESVWSLKGELGGLTRVAEFKAEISEWDERGRVTFSLEGVNEPVTGSGVFVASTVAASHVEQRVRKKSVGQKLAALGDAIARFLLSIVFRRADTPPHAQSAPASTEETQLTFNLTLSAGGMAGAALNMLIAPMLKPVAEDLANSIAAAVVARQR